MLVAVENSPQFLAYSLQRFDTVLVFFPVPPSVKCATVKRSTRRQAARALIENLPNVCAIDRVPVGSLRETPSIRGIHSRLRSRVSHRTLGVHGFSAILRLSSRNWPSSEAIAGPPDDKRGPIA